MNYHSVSSGRFLSRPNRFTALVDTDQGVQTVHVKNTGRCRELLTPGAKVYLERASNPARKTAFDLIAVEKGGLLINMDAQAPNQVFAEWAAAGNFLPDVTAIHSEYVCGASRLDFCLETPSGLHLVEVKGVTLEAAVEAGLSAALFFVVQMSGMKSVAPNDSTHPAFGQALREAAAAGVQVLAYDCAVTPSSLEIRKPVPVILNVNTDSDNTDCKCKP